MLLKFIGGIAKSSGRWLDNANWTCIVPASGKLELQKRIEKKKVAMAVIPETFDTYSLSSAQLN